MKASEFKTEMKNKIEFLKGKKINLVFMSGDTKVSSNVYTFNTLKGFGKAVLAFEKMGANFGCIKVGNSIVERGTKDIEELNHRIQRGVWTNVTFLATTVKY